MEAAADIATFAVAARRYCALVERAAELPLPERLSAFAETLVGVYMAALSLPDMAPMDGESLEPAAQKVRSGSRPGFGRYEVNRETVDPYDDEELSVAALSDAILAIARDIRNGLVLYDGGAGEQQANAVWAWRFSFVTHWGDHAVSALQHAIYRESGGPCRR